MNKIRVIDLLNKIANDEEVPEYVQYYNMLKDKVDIMLVCKENIFHKLDRLEIQLNSRIEPVEEEKKIPEKLDLILDEQFTNDELQAYIYETQEKVNQVIDYLDYLKSKGE